MSALTLPLVLTLTLTLCGHYVAWPFGATPESCGDMMPGHGKQSADPNPYTLEVTLAENATGSEPVSVTIRGGDFVGLLLIARRAGTSKVVGRFTSPAGTGLHPLDCGGKKATAVTQSTEAVKRDVTLTWNPPPGDLGEVEFVATMHQAKNVWWRNTKTDAVSYNGTGLAGDVMTGAGGTGGGAAMITGLGFRSWVLIFLISKLLLL